MSRSNYSYRLYNRCYYHYYLCSILLSSLFIQVLKSTSVTDISLLSDSVTSENDDITSLFRAGRMHTHDALEKPPQVICSSLRCTNEIARRVAVSLCCRSLINPSTMTSQSFPGRIASSGLSRTSPLLWTARYL